MLHITGTLIPKFVLHRTKETGYLPRRQPITFEVFGPALCCSAECRLDVWQKKTEMGLSFGFDVLTAGLRVHRTIFTFPESGLEELQIMEAFVVTPSLHQV